MTRFLPGIADFSYCLNKWRYRSMSDPEILSELVSLGAKCFQLDFLFDHEGGEENRRAIRKMADRAGITLTGADYGRPGPERFTRQIEAAKELGIEVVRHAWGPFLNLQEPRPLTEVASLLAEAARLYEKAGLYFALENHQDYPSADLEQVLRRIASPNVGIFLDTGNSIALAESPTRTAGLLAPFTFGVHVKEYAVLPAPCGFDLVGVPLGKGVVDNASILEILSAKAPRQLLPLLLENPLERCRVDIFAEPYRRHLGTRTLGSLGPVADLLAESKLKYPDGIGLPFEDGRPPEAAQESERAHNRQAYAKLIEMLGPDEANLTAENAECAET